MLNSTPPYRLGVTLVISPQIADGLSYRNGSVCRQSCVRSGAILALNQVRTRLGYCANRHYYSEDRSRKSTDGTHHRVLPASTKVCLTASAHIIATPRAIIPRSMY